MFARRRRSLKGSRDLYNASKDGDLTKVQKLLRRGDDPNGYKNKDGYSPLFIASSQGHTQIVRKLVEAGAHVNAVSENGKTPLLVAAVEGQLDIVKALLDGGALVNDADREGKAPLYVAAERGFLDVVKALLDAGALVNAAAKDRATPLIGAALEGCLAVVKALLNAGAHVNVACERGRTPLMNAALGGSLDLVAALRGAGALVNVTAKDGYTPLLLATEGGDRDVVKALLDAGARANDVAQDGTSPLIIAAACGHLDMVKGLLDAGAELNHRDSEGRTALDYAKRERRQVVVDFLGSRYAVYKRTRSTALEMDQPATRKPTETKSVSSDHDNFALPSGFSFDDVSSVQRYLRSGVDPNGYKDEFGCTLMLLACLQQATHIVRVLLAAGANVNVANNDGLTPLIAAARMGNLGLVKALVDAGADVQHEDNEGRTALYMSSRQGYTQIVRVLLVAGANVNAAGKNGESALIIAASQDRIDVVKSLLKAEAELQHKDHEGLTALLHVSAQGHTRIARELLDAGATFSANGGGLSPLMVAASRGHLDMVIVLLDVGAELHQKNGDGETALDIATREGHEEIVDFLQVAASRLSEATSKLWTSATNGSLTEEMLVDFLNSPNVNSIQVLIVAHNILLLALRQKVITLEKLKSFRDDTDYLATHIYLPLREFMYKLDYYEKVLCKYVLRHAEREGFIEKHHVFAIKLNADTYSEIDRSRRQMSKVLEKVARQLQHLGKRVNALEQWSTRVTEEIRKTCKNNEHMVEDIAKLGNSLNSLHEVLRKNERRRTYAGIAGLALSFIPVVGGALATGASASAEILLGMNQEDLFELGADAAKGTVSHLLSVDLSNFQTVGILTSERFMNSLDEPTKTRVIGAIESSAFQTVERFRKEFAEAQKVMKELDEKTEVDDGVESELASRFSLISVGADATASIRDAAPELTAFCQRRFPKFDTPEQQVRCELLKHCNRRTARLDFKGFRTAFNTYDEEYGTAAGSDDSFLMLSEALIELEDRFSGAVEGRSSIDMESAIVVLENLHADSADGEANKVSFTRTRDEWDGDEVEKLFAERRNSNGNITKEGFTAVGMQVLLNDG